MSKDICIVLMCNNVDKYKMHTIRTIKEIRTIGLYDGDIILLYDDDYDDEFKNKLTEYNVILKFFPKIDRTKFLEMFRENPFKEGDKREITKTFQYHKFYLFDKYFKNWKKIFYIDAGMYIFKPIQKC